MRYSLNKLKANTTNNFNINDLDIELNLPNNLEFKKFKTNSNIKYSEISNFTSKIGLNFNKALNVDIKEENKLIELIYEFSNGDNLIDNINIDCKKKTDIIIKYISLDDTVNFHHAKINLNIEKDSICNLTIINLLNENSYNFIAIESNVYGNLKTNIIDIKSNIKVNNVYSKVYDNALSELNNIYLGFNKNILDMNYYFENVGINSVSNIESQGVLSDCSIKKYRATVDFISGAENSKGDILENTILLSDTCKSSSVPILLCGEENVEGSHAVSTGKLKDENLFYLMSRGLSKDEAVRLLILTNMSKIINKIDNEVLEKELVNVLENML